MKKLFISSVLFLTATSLFAQQQVVTLADGEFSDLKEGCYTAWASADGLVSVSAPRGFVYESGSSTASVLGQVLTVNVADGYVITGLEFGQLETEDEFSVRLEDGTVVDFDWETPADGFRETGFKESYRQIDFSTDNLSALATFTLADAKFYIEEGEPDHKPYTLADGELTGRYSTSGDYMYWYRGWTSNDGVVTVTPAWFYYDDEDDDWLYIYKGALTISAGPGYLLKSYRFNPIYASSSAPGTIEFEDGRVVEIEANSASYEVAEDQINAKTRELQLNSDGNWFTVEKSALSVTVMPDAAAAKTEGTYIFLEDGLTKDNVWTSTGGVLRISFESVTTDYLGTYGPGAYANYPFTLSTRLGYVITGFGSTNKTAYFYGQLHVDELEQDFGTAGGATTYVVDGLHHQNVHVTPSGTCYLGTDFYVDVVADPTGIYNVETEQGESTVYDAFGRRVSAPVQALQPGVYIKDGKKFVLK